MVKLDIILQTTIQLARLSEEVADVLERAHSGEDISDAEWAELREGLQLVGVEWDSA